MQRGTIDYGIDLGTTNSSIAVARGAEIEVFKNNEGMEYTPSAVYLDRNNRLHVGKRAKNQVEADKENAFFEFKLQMGTERLYHFARSGRIMKPQELSAEVLKSLRGDVKQRSGEEITAAVITVPAAFAAPQTEATRQAAQLAGLIHSPLLQEPVAASLAYSLQSTNDKVFWLVYDLGGGTFDAAVMQVRDGEIQVVNHAGDNDLGGKKIDWAIVERLLIPHLTHQWRLADFQRGNAKWGHAIAKLKLAAEEAKIRLSRSETEMISIDALCKDERGEEVFFEYELRRRDVERLAEPLLLQTINLCKQALTEKRLGVGDIEKVLLAGGPTLAPYLRQQLADQLAGAGMKLDFSIDPLTVVARGAAVYASILPLPRAKTVAAPHPAGLFTVEFPEWTFAGNETEPVAAGIVKAPEGRSLQGYTLEMINTALRPEWRSGKLNLATNGAFLLPLYTEMGRLSQFTVEICDSKGASQSVMTDPDPLTYNAMTVGPGAVTLIHSLGVALANNEVEPLAKKGDPLELRSGTVLRTLQEVRPGQTDHVIRIPVVEGEHSRADRNRIVGNLEIGAHEVRRIVPANSEVEFKIEINKELKINARAYIPILDAEFEQVMTLGIPTPDLARLRRDFAQAQSRLQEVRIQIEETHDPQARRAFEQIEHEEIVRQVESYLQAAAADPDAMLSVENRLRDLWVAIDHLDDLLAWPTLAADSEELLANTQELVNTHGNADDRRQFQLRESEVRQALRSRDVNLLRQRRNSLLSLMFQVLDRLPDFHLARFEQLRQNQYEMRDPALAATLINQGHQAVRSGDSERLRAINRQLQDFLPVPPPPPGISDVMKG